ncbi:MauE/DoxX family redox-associated membrane protein [Streptosporangium canum]|uniref:MauE/DoxX family redox-associated membrane protein n=1 Tax=Streptosporangium canum TaxID=324952 RepID=UPI003694D0B1
MKSLLPGCATIIAVVLAVSLAGKLRNFPEFVESIKALDFIPRRLVALTAVLIAAIESILFLMTATAPLGDRRTTMAAFALSAMLFTVFGIVITISLSRGLAVRCHCFGRARAAFSVRHVVRNGILVVIALAGLATSASTGMVGVPETVISIASGLFCAIFLIAMDDVSELFA